MLPPLFSCPWDARLLAQALLTHLGGFPFSFSLSFAPLLSLSVFSLSFLVYPRICAGTFTHNSTHARTHSRTHSNTQTNTLKKVCGHIESTNTDVSLLIREKFIYLALLSPPTSFSLEHYGLKSECVVKLHVTVEMLGQEINCPGS